MRIIGLDIDQNGRSYAELLRMAKLADDFGFHAVSIKDRICPSRDSHFLEAWSLLSAFALNTKRTKLLTLVTNNLLRHPGLLAKITASVDRLSSGRVILGIGSGDHKKDLVDAGYVFPELSVRTAMLDESLDVISKLWLEREASFTGKYYKLENAESLPKPLRTPQILIGVGGGGNNEAILDVACRHSKYVNWKMARVQKDVDRALSQFRERCFVQKIEFESVIKTLSGTCVIAETSSELASKLLTLKNGLSLTKQNSIVGTPEEIVQRIEQLERFGIGGLFLNFPSFEMAGYFGKTVLRSISSNS